MFTLRLAYVKAPSTNKYRRPDGMLPQRMALVDVKAAASFRLMTEASERRIRYTDVYRSTLAQIEFIRVAIRDRTGKARLYAPPTKSGHQFGMSLDVSVDESLALLRASKSPQLQKAGESRDDLAEWMLRFGYHGISTEPWHFDFLDGHDRVTQRIQAVYGAHFRLDDAGVQRAVNALKVPGVAVLGEDGVLGKKSQVAIARARVRLGLAAHGGADAWFRRVLACATVRVEVVK